MSLIDDVDGEIAEETVAFALDGVRYETDLSPANAQRLRAVLSPWIEAAHPANRPSTSAGGIDACGGIGRAAAASPSLHAVVCPQH